MVISQRLLTEVTMSPNLFLGKTYTLKIQGQLETNQDLEVTTEASQTHHRGPFWKMEQTKENQKIEMATPSTSLKAVISTDNWVMEKILLSMTEISFYVYPRVLALIYSLAL